MAAVVTALLLKNITSAWLKKIDIYFAHTHEMRSEMRSDGLINGDATIRPNEGNLADITNVTCLTIHRTNGNCKTCISNNP